MLEMVALASAHSLRFAVFCTGSHCGGVRVRIENRAQRPDIMWQVTSTSSDVYHMNIMLHIHVLHALPYVISDTAKSTPGQQHSGRKQPQILLATATGRPASHSEKGQEKNTPYSPTQSPSHRLFSKRPQTVPFTSHTHNRTDTLANTIHPPHTPPYYYHIFTLVLFFCFFRPLPLKEIFCQENTQPPGKRQKKEKKRNLNPERQI